jgi:hypothetical protein
VKCASRVKLELAELAIAGEIGLPPVFRKRRALRQFWLAHRTDAFNERIRFNDQALAAKLSNIG